MKAILNWRHYVIALLLAAAVFLIGGQTESDIVFIITKPLGFICGYVMFRLIRHWNARGMITLFKDFTD